MRCDASGLGMRDLDIVGVGVLETSEKVLGVAPFLGDIYDGCESPVI